MMEDGVEAVGGGCVHRAWCGRSGRQAKPGQGLSSGETFGCASMCDTGSVMSCLKWM